MKHPKSLLLVDDDPVFRDRLARALEARGFRVHIAGTPELASKIWNQETFDGAIVDLRLAATSGLTLIPILRKDRPNARIIVLTGFSSIGTAMEAGRLGASDYLTKPVDVDRLLIALQEEPRETTTAPTALPDIPTLESVEWEHIQRVLADCDGNVSQTARMLGIDRRSLQRKLAKYPPQR